MANIIELPKLYNPDFRNPKKKPINELEIDWRNSLTKDLLLSLELQDGDLVDLVSGEGFTKNNVGIISSHQGGEHSLDFAGVGDEYSIFATCLEQLSGSEHSVEIEVAIDNWDSSGAVFFGWNDNGAEYWQHNPSTNQYFIAGSLVTGATAISADGAFNNIIFSAKSGANKVFLNGVVDATSTDTTSVSAGAKTLHIGRWIGGVNWTVDGRIKRVRVWNRNVTELEARRLNNTPYAFLKSKQPSIHFAPPVDAGVTVALTGVAATAVVGSVGNAKAIALATVLATSQVGSVSTSRTVNLSGIEVTAEVGSVSPGISISLTGNEVTGEVGTVVPLGDVIVALTGVEASAQVGSVGISLSVDLTGNEATADVGDISPAISVALTGNEVTSTVGDLANSTTVALLGNETTAEVGSVVTGEALINFKVLLTTTQIGATLTTTSIGGTLTTTKIGARLTT